MSLILPSNLKLALIGEPLWVGESERPPSKFFYVSRQEGKYTITEDKTLATKFDGHRAAVAATHKINDSLGTNFKCYLYRRDFNHESTVFDLELDTLTEL